MQGFDFGANWDAFSERRVDGQRLEAAAASLRRLLGQDRLEGTSFLDVGCGSGLFTLAARVLGAEPALGIDVNPRCIAVSRRNGEALLAGAPVRFQQASALDWAALAALGEYSLVYAWGSLHHTGAMWEAIRQVSRRVAPGGTLVLAIYNRHATSWAWKGIKWLYNRLPRRGQRWLVVPFAGVIYAAKYLVTRRNPLEKERGMDFWYDVVDWLGGYPYEYASPRQVETFVSQHGFVLRRLVPARVPTGCNEYVFERKSA